MIVSTLSTYPKKKVVEDLGIIIAYDAKFRAGLRINPKVEDYLESAKESLIKKAAKLGANAILGVSFNQTADKKLILIGTAVVLEDE